MEGHIGISNALRIYNVAKENGVESDIFIRFLGQSGANPPGDYVFFSSYLYIKKLRYLKIFLS